MASLNNTVVAAGSWGAIIDARGNRWTISSQRAVLENGLFAGFTANVTEIAYVNGVVWHENSAGSWYQWTGTGWLAGNNPLPVVSDTTILTAIQTVLSNQKTILAALGIIETDLSTLTAKVNAMSATQTDIDTNTQTILADVAAINAAVTNIQAEIAALKAANPAVDTTGLDAAVAALGTATAGVQAVPPATP